MVLLVLLLLILLLSSPLLIITIKILSINLFMRLFSPSHTASFLLEFAVT